jgi:sterol desaturase/sphingolipid hydroxylase (fatty acid hydroxylase superfamily)
MTDAQAIGVMAAHVWLALLALIQDGRTTLILAAIYAGALALELMAYRWLRRRWGGQETLTNILSGVIGIPANAVAGLLFASIYMALYNHRIITAPLSGWGFAAAVVVFEFCHYWQHRLQHEVGFFWAFHSVHHSSEEMNVTVPLRIMWGMSLLEPVYILMPLAGFSLLHFGFATLLVSAWGIFVHTRIVPKLGFVEHLLVTPANHRVHHGKELEYLDKNYALFLIWFDKIFGTHQLERTEPTYGLRGATAPRNPVAMQFAGVVDLARKVRRAPTWRDRVGYLVMPPGWSHSGVHTTTRAMLRAEAVARQEG